MNHGNRHIRPSHHTGKYFSNSILIPLILIGLILFTLGYLFLTTSTRAIKQQLKQNILMQARTSAVRVKGNIQAKPASLKDYFSKQLYHDQDVSIYSVKIDAPLPQNLSKDTENVTTSEDTSTQQPILAAYVPLKDLGLAIIAQQPLRKAYRPIRLHTVQTTIWLVVFYVLILFAFNIVSKHLPLSGATDTRTADLNHQLARLNQLRTEFVSILSRNFRTPLQRLKSGVSLLTHNSGPLESRQAENLKRIQTDTAHLTRLLENLSDLAKLETGQMELRYRSVDPGALLRSVLSSAETYAASKKIKLTTDSPDNLPNININLDRIIQILANIVENAIKSSPEGGQIRLIVIQPNNKFIQMNVTDLARNMTREDINKLLPAKAITLSDAQTLRGEHIELSIGRRMVELHGGRLWIKSKPGRGTNFSLTLPIANK